MIHNQFNYTQMKISFEPTSKLPSETIQGDSFTIQQLVSQMSQGTIPQSKTDIQYQVEPSHDLMDMEKFHNLDLMDKKPIIEQITLDNALAYEQHKEYAKQSKKQAETQLKNDLNQQQPSLQLKQEIE